jgi:hypothetical protein
MNRIQAAGLPGAVITVLGVGAPKSEVGADAGTRAIVPTAEPTFQPSNPPSLVGAVSSNETSFVAETRLPLRGNKNIEIRLDKSRRSEDEIRKIPPELRVPVGKKDGAREAKLVIKDTKLVNKDEIPAPVTPALRGNLAQSQMPSWVEEKKLVTKQEEPQEESSEQTTVVAPIISSVQENGLIRAIERNAMMTKNTVKIVKNTREEERSKKLEMQKKLLQRKKELGMLPHR